MTLERRRFMAHLGVGGALVACPPALQALVARMAFGGPGRVPPARRPAPSSDYGRLVPAGPELALPEGFSYVVLGQEGSRMADGTPTPGAHDGMAAFPLPNGHVRLIRNHEDRNRPALARRLGIEALAYDPLGGGGTTSLEVRLDPDGAPELVREFVSLGGTIVNCAGGPTPWGTWLTCEESIGGHSHGWRRPHGYVFEVPVLAEEQVEAVPLVAMGRFIHEAAAIDPATGIVYMTEDRHAAGFYRFLPELPERLSAGGRLQMLAVEGRPRLDTRAGVEPGVPLGARWVDIDDPVPADAGFHEGAVFAQGYARGAAGFSRLEGCGYGEGAVYFQATDGGTARAGQVWSYRPEGADGGELTLVFESPDREVLDGPDNLIVSPRGGLLICEDGAGEQYLRGLTRDGDIFDFGRNVLNDREFAGATFSPDGRVLFVNIQGDMSSGGPGHPSMTLAIWGPWESGPL